MMRGDCAGSGTVPAKAAADVTPQVGFVMNSEPSAHLPPAGGVKLPVMVSLNTCWLYDRFEYGVL